MSGTEILVEREGGSGEGRVGGGGCLFFGGEGSSYNVTQIPRD